MALSGMPTGTVLLLQPLDDSLGDSEQFFVAACSDNADGGQQSPAAVSALALLPLSLQEAAQHAAAWFEVVFAKEPYIGLRSWWAGGKFLQARRRSPCTAFFSTHLGVWEQWEVEVSQEPSELSQIQDIPLPTRLFADDGSGPAEAKDGPGGVHTQWAIRFTNRQLPAIQLLVCAHLQQPAAAGPIPLPSLMSKPMPMPQQALTKLSTTFQAASPKLIVLQEPLPAFESGLASEYSTAEGFSTQYLPASTPTGQQPCDGSLPPSPHTSADLTPTPTPSGASEPRNKAQPPWQPAVASIPADLPWTKEKAARRGVTDSGANLIGVPGPSEQAMSPLGGPTNRRLSIQGFLPSATPATTRRRWSTAEGVVRGTGGGSMAGSILAVRARTSTLNGASTSSFADTVQLWNGPHTSFMDDVLYLSHRVVKGWVARVGRAVLYITFKLWMAQARRSAALLLAAAEHDHAFKLKGAFRAWSAVVQRSQRLRIASWHMSCRWERKLTGCVFKAWQDVVLGAHQDEAAQQQIRAEGQLQQQLEDSQQQLCRLQEKLHLAALEQTAMEQRWEHTMQQQADLNQTIQQVSQDRDSSQQQVLNLQQQLEAATLKLQEAAQQVQVSEGKLQFATQELEHVCVANQQQQVAAQQQFSDSTQQYAAIKLELQAAEQRVQEVLSAHHTTEKQQQQSEQELVAAQHALEQVLQESTHLQQEWQVAKQKQQVQGQQVQHAAAAQIVTAVNAVQLQLLWRAWCAQCSYSRNRAHQVVCWHVKRILRSVWAAWKQQAQADVLRQHAAGKLQLHWRHRQARAALHAWHAVADSLRGARELACMHATMRAQGRLLWLVFHAWRSQPNASAERAQPLAVAAQRQRLQRQLKGWHLWARRKAVLRITGSQLASVVQTRLTARTFFAWQQVARAGLQRGRIGARVQQRHSWSVLSQALRAWAAIMHAQRQHEQQVEGFAVQRRQRLLQHAFYHWAICTSIIKAATALTRNHQQRHLLHVFRQWRHIVSERQQLKWLVQQYQSFLSSRLRSKIWKAWQALTWSPWPLSWMPAGYQARASTQVDTHSCTSFTRDGHLPHLSNTPLAVAPPSSPPAMSYGTFSPRSNAVALSSSQHWFAGSSTAPGSSPQSPRHASTWPMMTAAAADLIQIGWDSRPWDGQLLANPWLIPGLMPLYRLRAKQVLLAWHHACRRKRYFQFAVWKLQHHKARMLLASSFHALYKHAKHLAQAYQHADHLSAKRQQRLINAALQGWLQVTVATRRVRVLCHRLGKVRRYHILQRYLASWQATVAQHKSGRQQLHNIAAARRHRLLRECVRLWRTAVIHAGQQVHAADRMVNARMLQRQRSLLLCWQQVSRSSSEQTAALLRHAAAVRQHRLCRIVLLAWHRVAHEAMQEREHFPWMCRAFYSWLALAQNPGSVPSPDRHARHYTSARPRQHTALDMPPLRLMGPPSVPANSQGAATMPTQHAAALQPAVALQTHEDWDERGAVPSPVGQPRFHSRTATATVISQTAAAAGQADVNIALPVHAQQSALSAATDDVQAGLHGVRLTSPAGPVRSVTPTKSQALASQQAWPGAERVQRQLQHARELARSVEAGLHPAQNRGACSCASQPLQPAAGHGLPGQDPTSLPAGDAVNRGMDGEHQQQFITNGPWLSQSRGAAADQGQPGLDSMVEQLRQRSLSALSRLAANSSQRPNTPSNVPDISHVTLHTESHATQVNGSDLTPQIQQDGSNAISAGVESVTAGRALGQTAPGVPSAAAAVAAAAAVQDVAATTAAPSAGTQAAAAATVSNMLGAGLPAGSVMVVMVPPHTASHATTTITTSQMANLHGMNSSLMFNAPQPNTIHASSTPALLLDAPSPTPSSVHSPTLQHHQHQQLSQQQPVQQPLPQQLQQQPLLHQEQQPMLQQQQQQVLRAATSDSGVAYMPGSLPATTTMGFATTHRQPVCASVSPTRRAGAPGVFTAMQIAQGQGWAMPLGYTQHQQQQQPSHPRCQASHGMQQHANESQLPGAQVMASAHNSVTATAPLSYATGETHPQDNMQANDAAAARGNTGSNSERMQQHSYGAHVSSMSNQAVQVASCLPNQLPAEGPMHSNTHQYHMPHRLSTTGVGMQPGLGQVASQRALQHLEDGEESIQGLRARRDYILEQLQSVAQAAGDMDSLQCRQQQQQQQQETVPCTELNDYLSLLGVLPLSNNGSRVSSNRTSAAGTAPAPQHAQHVRSITGPAQPSGSQYWSRRTSRDENEGTATLSGGASHQNGKDSGAGSGMPEAGHTYKPGPGRLPNQPASGRSLLASVTNTLTAGSVPHSTFQTLHGDVLQDVDASDSHVDHVWEPRQQQAPAHSGMNFKGMSHSRMNYSGTNHQRPAPAVATHDRLLNSYQRLLGSSLALEGTLAATLDGHASVASIKHAPYAALDALAEGRLPAWQNELVLPRDPSRATAGRAVLEQLCEEGHDLRARLAVHALASSHQQQLR